MKESCVLDHLVTSATEKNKADEGNKEGQYFTYCLGQQHQASP